MSTVTTADFDQVIQALVLIVSRTVCSDFSRQSPLITSGLQRACLMTLASLQLENCERPFVGAIRARIDAAKTLTNTAPMESIQDDVSLLIEDSSNMLFTIHQNMQLLSVHQFDDELVSSTLIHLSEVVLKCRNQQPLSIECNNSNRISVVCCQHDVQGFILH